MLPKANRLKKKKDFERVFKSGRAVKNGFLVLRALKNSLNINRFAFVVSKKVSTKATTRNKVRRRLSSVTENEIQNIKDGFDVVLLALPGLEKNNFEETKKHTANLLNKIKKF